MKTLISIVGTTGIGKTRLAIDLAKKFRTEIISCDSRQFFREMKIGTAAPTDDELREAPHHFIGHLSVQDYYSIGQFEKDALQLINQLFEKHDILVLAGGSMMYEKAVIDGLNDLPEANPANQDLLKQTWDSDGYDELLNQLKYKDPEYYAVVDLENPRRILRALDVMLQTGKKYSELISGPKAKRNFRVIRIGIEAPREVIYDRINQRVDGMIANGLLEEVAKLAPHKDLTALKTVGYSELFRHLSGEWSREFAIEEIKKNSRRFAKRQLTWYRGEDNIHWVNYRNPFTESLSLLENYGLAPKT